MHGYVKKCKVISNIYACIVIELMFLLLGNYQTILCYIHTIIYKTICLKLYVRIFRAIIYKYMFCHPIVILFFILDR